MRLALAVSLDAMNSSLGSPNSAPVNIALPTIFGSGTVGDPLTGMPGLWSGVPTPTLAYEWYADGVLISGPTGLSYTPVAGDDGKVITMKEKATNVAGGPISAISNGIVARAGVITVPTVLVAGTGVNAGSTHTTASFTPAANTRLLAYGCSYRNSGTISPKGVITDSVGLNWTQVGDAATATTSPFGYHITAYVSDVITSPVSMTVTVTCSGSVVGVGAWVLSLDASQTAGSVLQQTSGEDAVAGDAAFTFASAPRSNSLALGFYISANTTADIPAPTGYAQVAAVSAMSWTSKRSMICYDNTAAAIGPNQAFSSGTKELVLAIEIASTYVSAVAPSIVADVVISGSTLEGSILTATSAIFNGIPTPDTFLQWYAGTTPIFSINQMSIDTTGYAGQAITAKQQATNSAGSVISTSNSITVVAAASQPVNTSAPTISGSSLVGSVLTSVDGTWSGTPAPSVTREWWVGGVATGNTTSNYTIVSGDAGKSIIKKETAVNTAGTVIVDSNSIVATVPVVTTTQSFGALSRAGHGGIAAPAGATAISGGTATGWTMSGGIVAMTSDGSGTAGTLTFTGSATVWTMTLVANAMSVGNITEFNAVGALAPAVLNNTTRLVRPGTYQWPNTQPTGAYTNWRTEAHDQSSPSQYPTFLMWGAANPSSQPYMYGSGWYWKRINFYSEFIKGTHDPNFMGLALGGASAGNNTFEECEFYGNYNTAYRANSSLFTVDTSTNTVTHTWTTLTTGEKVRLAFDINSSDLPSPLNYAVAYYWIKLTSTTGRFATSAANAAAGTAITLTTEGANTYEMFQDVGFQCAIGVKTTFKLAGPVTFLNCKVHDHRGLFHLTDNNPDGDVNAFAGFTVDGCDLYNYHTDVCQLVGGANHTIKNCTMHDPVGLTSSSHVDCLQAMGYGVYSNNAKCPDLVNVQFLNNTFIMNRTDGYRGNRQSQCAFFEDIASNMEVAPYGMQSFKFPTNWSPGAGFSIVGDTLVCSGGAAGAKTSFATSLNLSPSSRYQISTKLLTKASALGNVVLNIKNNGTLYATSSYLLSSLAIGGEILLTFMTPSTPSSNWTFEIVADTAAAQFSIGSTTSSLGFRINRYANHRNHIVRNNLFVCKGNAVALSFYNGEGCTADKNVLVCDPALNLPVSTLQPCFLSSSVWISKNTLRAAVNNFTSNVGAKSDNSLASQFIQTNPVDTYSNNYMTDARDASADANLGANHKYSDLFVGPTFSGPWSSCAAARAAFQRKVGGPLDTASPKIGID